MKYTSFILPAVAIIILAIFVVNLNRIFPVPQENTNIITQQNVQTASFSTCLEQNNIKENGIIFLYSDSCPFCKQMKPIVQKLEAQGYNFYWVTSGSPVISCISDVLSAGVPQFICTETKQARVGIMSEQELAGFADECLESNKKIWG